MGRATLWSLLALLVLTSCGPANPASNEAGGKPSPQPVTSPSQQRPEPKSPASARPTPASNGRIAFIADYRPKYLAHPMYTSTDWNDVYTVLPDGSSLRRLTHTGDVQAVSWSPNGHLIAYVRDAPSGPQGGRGLWVMDSDGRHQQRILHPNYPWATTVDWSPDGNYLASSGVDAIGVFVTDVQSGATKRVGEGKLDHSSPRWSSDGHTIAFASSGGILMMDANGRNARAVPGTGRALYFDWSWANGQFVFASRQTGRGDGCYGDLFVTLPHDRAPLRITTAPCMESTPTWSPDGRSVAFISHGGLWLVDADGRHPREIVPHRGRMEYSINGTPAEPDWQPLP